MSTFIGRLKKFKVDKLFFYLTPTQSNKQHLKNKAKKLHVSVCELGRVLYSKHFFFCQRWKIRLVIPLKLVKCHSCVFKLSYRRSRWVCLRLQGGHGCNLPKVTIINVKLLQQYVCERNWALIIYLKLHTLFVLQQQDKTGLDVLVRVCVRVPMPLT